jgi:hypothetical protein
VGEIQRLDPEFRKVLSLPPLPLCSETLVTNSCSQEDWAEEVKREISPKIIQAHLDGDLKILKPRLGEAVYNKLAADIRTVCDLISSPDLPLISPPSLFPSLVDSAKLMGFPLTPEYWISMNCK